MVEVRGGRSEATSLQQQFWRREPRKLVLLYKTLPPLPITAIFLTHVPNPFRDSLRSSQVFMSYVSGTAALITASVKSSGLDGASVGSLKRLMIVVTIVFLHGGLRLRYLTWEGAPNAPGFTTMRVAGVWLKNTMVIREALLRHHLGHLVDGLPGPGEGMDTWNGRGWEEVKAWSKEDLDVLEEEVKREALSGADVIMTPELALVTFQGPGVDEGDDMSTEFVLERLAKIARDNGVYLGVGEGERRLERSDSKACCTVFLHNEQPSTRHFVPRSSQESGTTNRSSRSRTSASSPRLCLRRMTG